MHGNRIQGKRILILGFREESSMDCDSGMIAEQSEIQEEYVLIKIYNLKFNHFSVQRNKRQN